MAHHRRYRHRRTMTFAEAAAVSYRQSLCAASMRPPSPLIVQAGDVYYVNEPAMKRLREEFPQHPGAIDNTFFAFAGVEIRPMPKWMEGLSVRTSRSDA